MSEHVELKYVSGEGWFGRHGGREAHMLDWPRNGEVWRRFLAMSRRPQQRAESPREWTTVDGFGRLGGLQ